MNEYFDIDDLPFSTKDKKRTLEYLSQKLYRTILNFNDSYDHHKSYDPLTIKGNVAHTYVFSLSDGGRHHTIESLQKLEDEMMKETEEIIRTAIAEDIIDIIKKQEGVSVETKKTLTRKIISGLKLEEKQTSYPYIPDEEWAYNER